MILFTFYKDHSDPYETKGMHLINQSILPQGLIPILFLAPEIHAILIN